MDSPRGQSRLTMPCQYCQRDIVIEPDFNWIRHIDYCRTETQSTALVKLIHKFITEEAHEKREGASIKELRRFAFLDGHTYDEVNFIVEDMIHDELIFSRFEDGHYRWHDEDYRHHGPENYDAWVWKIF
jgi:hypothetical protein